jgi:hypothetical protein
MGSRPCEPALPAAAALATLPRFRAAAEGVAAAAAVGAFADRLALHTVHTHALFRS